MCKLSLSQFINYVNPTSLDYKWNVVTPAGRVLDVTLDLIVFGSIVVICHSEQQAVYITNINVVLYDHSLLIYKLCCADGVYILSRIG